MRTIRFLLPALVLLALAGPATVQAAVPGVNLVSTKCPPRDVLGNITDSNVQKCDIDEAADLGAKSVRLFVRWTQGEPSAAGSYDQGYLNKFRDRTADAVARGMKVYLPILTTPAWASGSNDPNTPPSDPNAFAAFAAKLADTVGGGSSVIYEVWNEQDEPAFWSTGPDAARYTAMLRSAYGAIKAKNPQAQVLFGALTGGNYDYLKAAYAAGAKGSFDGVAVHTDTACLVRPPDFYVRNVGPGLDGRINRFSFLGYREVRRVMLEQGDDKPIHMTELGWAAFTDKCDQPGFEGQPDRLGGVTAAEQAANLRTAFRCLANDSYVSDGLWFSLRDFDAQHRSTSKYGLIGRPAEGVFRDVAARGEPAGECGDFTPPSITPLLKVTEFTGSLPIAAKATDASGVTRISLTMNGKLIRNFTGAEVGNDRVVSIDWQGAKDLKPGKHTLTIEAIDLPSNLARTEVVVTKVDPTKVNALPTKVESPRVKVRKGRRALVVLYLSKTGRLALGGKVRAEWQTKRPAKGKKGKRKLAWKKIHGGLKSVKISPTGQRGKVQVAQKLRFKGRWRVRLTYLGKPPYRRSASQWVYFTAK